MLLNLAQVVVLIPGMLQILPLVKLWAHVIIGNEVPAEDFIIIGVFGE